MNTKTSFSSLKLWEEHDLIMRKFSIFDSPVFKEIEKQNALFESFNKTLAPIDKMMSFHKTWKDKFDYAFSPVWEQMDVFSKFHNQTANIGNFISPIINDFIHKNVRTNYIGIESISSVEIVFLETFEQINEEVDIDMIQKANLEIQKSPDFQEELKILFKSFYQAHLRTEFTDAIADLINRKLQLENKKIIPILITILIILYTIWASIQDKVDS